MSAATVAAPLASFAATKMIVLPVQYLAAGEALGWSTRAGDPKKFLVAVDSALEVAFRGRGLGTVWAFPTDLVRTARRNPTYTTDPAAIRAGDAVRVMERRKGAEIPEPVGSQLRALVGFHDARYAMVPVELRFEGNAAGPGGRAVLHVAILDVRGSALAWSGDIGSEMTPLFSPGIATALASRFAGLVVPR
jgi:hypothetical protein